MTVQPAPRELRPTADGLARAVLTGAATGGRTFTGIAAQIAVTPAAASRQPDRALSRPGVQTAVALAALWELIVDKRAGTPSRLQPPGLPLRLAAGAVGGALVAVRQQPDTSSDVPTDGPAEAGDDTAGAVARKYLPAAACVAAAAATAVLTAHAGLRWRLWAAPRLRSATAAALLEDVVVLGLAACAVRPAPFRPPGG